MIGLNNIYFQYLNSEQNNLDNINLKVNKGEFVLVCGCSGSGKTSITRLVNKLIPDYYEGKLTGQVSINNNKLDQFEMFELSKIVGSVFQNPKTQFFNIDTDSEIVFGLENHGVPRNELLNRLNTTYRELGIEKLRGRNIFHLSGGEKQKIAFASVYAMNPEVYLLDEPSSNLDLETIDEFKKCLSILKDTGKTVIISEHRIYYLMELVDKIIYIKEGKIHGCYSKDDFLNLSNEEIEKMGLRSRTKTELFVDESQIQKESTTFIVNNLSIRRKDKMIQKNIDFKAQKGDIVAVLGSNGVGKTSFLRTICGLHNTYDGTIYIDEHKADCNMRRQKSYMVMQDVNYQLFADSVYSECKLGIKNVSDTLIDEILTDFGLIEFKDKHPNTLSGGQKQRLAIAVGLISNKEVFILDEPTSGLDYINMIKTSELLKKYSRDKIIFVATHDTEFANIVCNRILNLEKYKV